MVKKTIEVKKERFVNFLKLLSLKGDICNKSAVLDFKADKVIAYTIAPANSVATKGVWNAKFDTWGEIGLTNIETLNSFITPLRGTKIFIDIDKNKFKTTSENGKVKSKNILSNIQYITNTLSPEQYENIKAKAVGNEVTIPNDIIKEILTYVTSVNSKDLFLKIGNNKLTLIIENKQDQIEATFDMTTPVGFEEISLRMAYYFTDILALAEGDVTLSAKPNSPVFLTIKQYDSEFEYLMLAKKLYGDMPLHCRACGATNEDYPRKVCEHIPEDLKNWEYQLQ